jgi:uncharacterized protein with GYD domain
MNVSYTFNASLISMDAQASITVPYGIGFTVQNSTNIMGCDEMWNGIVVRPGGNLTLTASTFEDAERLVFTQGHVSLTIQDNYFRNNFIGIRLFSAFPGLLGVSQPFPMTGNTFIANDNMLPPHTGELGFAGIQLQNISGFTVGTTNTGASPNVFENLQNGIVANRSSFAVHKCIFQNMNPGDYGFPPSINIPSVGYGVFVQNRSNLLITKCNFERLHLGVHAANSSLEAYDNVIENSPIGEFGVVVGIRAIESTNQSRIKIHDNQIDVTRYGMILNNLGNASVFEIQNNIIKVGDPNPLPLLQGITGMNLSGCNFPQTRRGIIQGNTILLTESNHGLQISECSYIRILENNITVLEEGGITNGIRLIGGHYLTVMRNNIQALLSTPSSVSRGIFVSSSSNNHYCCNTINGSDYSLWFEGVCMNPHSVLGTIFGNADVVGLEYSSDAITGAQFNTNNRWEGTFYGEVAARHQGNSQTIIQSRYRVSPFAPPTLPPTVAPTSGWFLPLGTPAYFDCSTTTDCLLAEGPGELDESELTIAAGNWESGLSYQSTLNWQAERYLHQKLEDYPGLLIGQTTVQSFYTNKLGAPVQLFNDVASAIGQLADVPPSETGQYSANLAAIFERLQELTEKDHLLWGATGATASALQAERNTSLAELQTLEGDNEGFAQTISANRLAVIEQILAQNNGILVSEVFEQNEKTVNRIWLETLAQGITTFTPQQANDLAEVANQCPKTGGNAVFAARGMYEFVNYVEYDDDANCGKLENRADGQNSPEVSKTSLYGIYPNPAHSQLTVSLPLADNIGELVMANLVGQIVRSFPLSAGHPSHTVNICDLPEGIYFCKIFLGEDEVYSRKIIISH